jgi:hypothetical protein
MMNNLRLTASVALLALGLVSVTGCGNSIAPGEYRIYKMDIQAAQKSDGCYAMDMPDPNTKFDTDTTLGTTTWVLTADTSDNIYLDLGKSTFVGAVSDAGYTFKGEVVNVDFEDNDLEKTKTTITATTVIDITLDGKSLGGTSVSTGSYSCTNPSLTAPCPKTLPSNCSETVQFAGTQVDDVELEYTVK